MKSGGAPPHSKTQARNVSLRARPRFGVRQCFAALGAAAAVKFVELLLLSALFFGVTDATWAAQESLGTKIKKFWRRRQRRLHPQTSKTLDEETDAYSIADCFCETKEGFADSIPDAEEQIKTQEDVSYSNTGRIAFGNGDSVRESGGITRTWSRKKRLA